MKKTILLSSIVVFLITISVAQGSKSSPWDEVWNAIAGLQEQIDNLILTPGPEGPQGDPGPQGPAGKSLHVFDKNNQDLGHLLDVKITATNQDIWSPSEYYTYLPDLNVISRFRANEDNSSAEFKVLNKTAYFEEENCTGEPYVRDFKNPTQGLYKDYSGHTPPFFKVIETDTPIINLVSLSYTATSSPEIPNNCINETSIIPKAYQIQEINLPFSEPITAPIRIMEQ